MPNKKKYVQDYLINLIKNKKIKKIDSIAIANIFTNEIEAIGITKEEYIKSIMYESSELFAILETSLGRIGLCLIPVVHEEVYTNDKLLSEISKLIYKSIPAGTKSASLTGLIPSATNYGKDINNIPHGFIMTTGHGATVSAMVLNLENIMYITGRDISNEVIAFVGLGSIGLTTLRLVLTVLKHPKKILICDLFSKYLDLENIKLEICSELRFKGKVEIVQSENFDTSNEIYQSKLIIGATNVPGILNTQKLKSGTIILDDTAPHIFDFNEVIDRFRKTTDILAIQGGKLMLPKEIKFTHNPAIKTLFSDERNKKIQSLNKNEIMGCTLGSILPQVSNLTPATIGKVQTSTAESYYNFFKMHNIKASLPQCMEYYYTKDEITKFSTF